MDSSEHVVLKVNGVSKHFLLPHERITSLKNAFLRFWRLHRRRTVQVQHALNGVSLAVKKGEFFGVLGRNGSGKSTLLKIMAGIYQPTRGGVQTDGKLVPFIELGVGFNPELTGRENVYLNGALLGFSRTEVQARYNQIVAFAELEEFMDLKLKNYSSGMQVRLAFSVAITADADILLVDEVLAVGDAAFKRKCYRYFKDLKRRGKTVIFVSHDMDAVRAYCDRAVLIKDGKVHAEGKAEKMAQEYLRLFNDTLEPEEGAKQTGSDNRWGNGWVTYSDVDFELTPQSLVITARANAFRDLDDLVCGVRIRNEAGDEVTGTNSLIKGLKPFSVKQGDKLKLQWEMPNIFSSGDYFIEPALHLTDAATVCDWWNEAKKFRVDRPDSTAYIVTPDIKLSISNG